MFIQDLWEFGYDWDDPLTEADIEKWNTIVQEISDFHSQVPRHHGVTCDNAYDLVLCSDASKRVYATAVYILTRHANDSPRPTLLFAKAKLAPPGAITIPRMELLACHMAAKTAKILISQCKIIRRVLDELRADNIATGFYYLNTDNNPADCATRGLTATELQDHLWWTGPSFFATPSSQWPWKSLEPSVSSLPGAEAEELKAVTTSTNTISEPYVSFVPFTRTNSYIKLIRVTAYVLKFLARVRHRVETRCHREHQDVQSILGTMDITPVVTPDDFTTAESLLIREHYREGQQQLDSPSMKKFRTTCDKDGNIRVDRRMSNAQTDNSTNPILILSDHPLCYMLIIDRSYARTVSLAGPPRVGEVVLVRQDAHRSTWPLALILELNASSDGNVRSAKIRTAKKKILKRSINHLVPLEIVADDDTIPERSRALCSKGCPF
ncbi:unnamed protein product [Cylicocyclus nassatus]|uniref:DUF5641 domain-containing protein n=1 Tax=Cylicocyclus nassatus TaxID=53992 RepID=A0AA36M2W0_CYLNA|nr:unnamed protein product [Cylicocyclus nassatus]